MTGLRAFAVWLVIIVADSLHGTLRELLLAPRVGELRAHQIAVFTGSILIVSIAIACARWLQVRDTAVLIRIGLMWVVLTVAFEIALGRLVLNFSWTRIAADYDLARGGLMGFGLLALTLAPLIGARLRRMIGEGKEHDG